MAGAAAIHLHPLDLERVGAPDGAEVKVSSARASVVLPITADRAVLRGTAWVPFGLAGANIGDLIDSSAPVTDVRVESL